MNNTQGGNFSTPRPIQKHLVSSPHNTINLLEIHSLKSFSSLQDVIIMVHENLNMHREHRLYRAVDVTLISVPL